MTRHDIRLELGGIEERIQVSARNAADNPRAMRFNPPAKPCIDSGAGGAVRPPVKVIHVVPAYPQVLRDSRIDGTVVIKGNLAVDGTPQKLRSPNRALAESALDGLRHMRFQPVLLNCVPQEISMTVTIVFSLR